MSAKFTLNVGAVQQVGRRVENLVEAIAIMARDEVVETMEGAPPRTGREYPIPGTESTYTASAPSEVPAIREGRYLASWKSTRAGRSGEYVRARAYTDLKVGENEEYVLGELLEDGTGKMAPRPHVIVAFDTVQEPVRDLVRRASA